MLDTIFYKMYCQPRKRGNKKMFKITLTQKQAQAITSASLSHLKEVEEIRNNPKPNMTLSTYWLLLYNGLKTGTKKLEQEYNLYIDKLEQDEENKSKQLEFNFNG